MYKRLLFVVNRLISICLFLAFALFSYLTIREAHIWVFGSRATANITELKRIGDDDYVLRCSFPSEKSTQVIEKRITTKAFNHLSNEENVSIIFLPATPDRNIVLDLKERNNIIGLLCGVFLSVVGVIVVIKKKGDVLDR